MTQPTAEPLEQRVLILAPTGRDGPLTREILAQAGYCAQVCKVARRLRSELARSICLVALTGYGQPGDRARTREAGFDLHLVKPVEPAQLRELLSGAEIPIS